MAGNLLIVHGGGPTAVINSSLYGAIRQAQDCPLVDRVYAAIGGTGGLLNEKLRDVTDIPDAELRGLLSSPASAIGTSRDALEAPEYEAMVPILEKYGIRYVLMNGGNGTMDTCGKLYARCAQRGINVIGIPKTMDNDLAITDHSPGLRQCGAVHGRQRGGSLLRRGGPAHPHRGGGSLGRNAGWVTAAASLATDSYAHGPDLIYLPERAFKEEEFLCDVEQLIKTKGHGGGGCQRGSALRRRHPHCGAHLHGGPGHLLWRCVRPSGEPHHQKAGLQGPCGETGASWAGRPSPGRARPTAPKPNSAAVRRWTPSPPVRAARWWLCAVSRDPSTAARPSWWTSRRS